MENNDKNIEQDNQNQQPNLQPDQQQKKQEIDKYKNLTENIENLTKNLQKRLAARKQRKIKRRQELNDLLDSIEESSNVVVSKIQDLNRKPTIMIIVSKILPQVPENFPKNYNVQITYEDVVVTGNQKFIDFDENNIDDKLILPLLTLDTAKLQIWTAQEQPAVFDKAYINLQKDIEQAINTSNYQSQINLESNPQIQISYSMQLQGMGFAAWLKNLKATRQAQQERSKAILYDKQKTQKNRLKVEEKKLKFSKKFNSYEPRVTKQYNMKGIDEILDNLNDD